MTDLPNKGKLCDTCYNALMRKWETEESIFTQTRCTTYPYKNVTFLKIIECSKYEEKKLTRKEFEEEKKGGNQID